MHNRAAVAQDAAAVAADAPNAPNAAAAVAAAADAPNAAAAVVAAADAPSAASSPPALFSSTGPCKVSGACVCTSNYDDTCESYYGNYGNYETCDITALADVLHVTAFRLGSPHTSLGTTR